MAVKRATRPSIRQGRAKVSTLVRDTEIISEDLERDWRRGTLWAGVGMVLVWGPLLLMYAAGWF